MTGKVLACLVALLPLRQASGADWLSVRADTHASAYQPHEKVLSATSIRKLQLLWTQSLQTPGTSLSDPILLGPIITERGVKELVFVRNAQTVFAVDADLGRIFWTRTIASDPASQRKPCPMVGSASMLLHHASDEPEATADDDDEYSDGDRPLYVLTRAGQVSVLRPSTGGDLLAAFSLIDPQQTPLDLFESQNVLYATSAKACGEPGAHLWSKSADTFVKSTVTTSEEVMATIPWKGRTLAVSLTKLGDPILHPAKAAELATGQAAGRGLATWEDKLGARWICTTTESSIRKYRVQESSTGAVANLTWKVAGLQHAGPPSVANGIVYFLSQLTGHLVLHALDTRDGTELYNSGDGLAAEFSTGNLSIANGHVCFSAAPAAVACFGLPFAL